MITFKDIFNLMPFFPYFLLTESLEKFKCSIKFLPSLLINQKLPDSWLSDGFLVLSPFPANNTLFSTFYFLFSHSSGGGTDIQHSDEMKDCTL